ncbi:hypothetical protein, partial [Candidatus Ichthyocystis sparus]|uniref:hypothetical protein n=2 Tax=Candidatus Ichthyocystis sparus TaxID=1561004 RepID=UPI001F5F1D4D
LNRKFLCKVSLLENRYLVSMVLGTVLGAIGKDIPGITGLLDSYKKSLRDVVLGGVSRGLFFALDSSNNVVPLGDFKPVIEGVCDYLSHETLLRTTSRKRVFRDRFRIRDFAELDGSGGGSVGFYKSLDGVILDGKNYIGNGFSYYLMRIFTPVCVSMARDFSKIFASSVSGELSSLTCFRLESAMRSGVFYFIFSFLSGIHFLREIDNKLEKISPHVGMNVCELYDDIFSVNLIEILKEDVISTFTVTLFKGFLPKTISTIDSEGKSISTSLTEDVINYIFESCASIFCEKIRNIVIEKDFLVFYIKNTLFKEFGECCFTISNVDISRLYPVKLDLICKIVDKIDSLYYMSKVFHAKPSFFMPDFNYICIYQVMRHLQD